jgi:hypothetical protein
MLTKATKLSYATRFGTLFLHLLIRIPGYDPLERVDLGTEGILRIELKKVSPVGKEG